MKEVEQCPKCKRVLEMIDWDVDGFDGQGKMIRVDVWKCPNDKTKFVVKHTAHVTKTRAYARR